MRAMSAAGRSPRTMEGRILCMGESQSAAGSQCRYCEKIRMARPATRKLGSDTPITVRVHLSSSKLVFPDGDIVKELAPMSFTEVPIKVEARTRGVSPVTLTVLTPAGDQLAVPVQLSAEVNALSGFGNLVTGAFLLVVLTWWVRHLRQNRRRRAAAVAAQRHPGGNRHTSSREVADELSPDAATSTLPRS